MTHEERVNAATIEVDNILNRLEGLSGSGNDIAEIGLNTLIAALGIWISTIAKRQPTPKHLLRARSIA